MMLFSSRFSQAHARLVQAGAVLVSGVLVAGCGAGYRPVISPINPSGPAAQPTSYVAVVSAPSPTSAGVATIIDYSGDTIMAQAPIGPGPSSFTIDQTGSNGYTVNSDGTLTNFPISTTLQQKQVEYTTLPTAASVTNLFSPSTGLWSSDLNGNAVDVLNGFPETFKLSIPVAPGPLMVVGPGILGQRNYLLAQNFVDQMKCNGGPSSVSTNGEADALEVSSNTVSARIPLDPYAAAGAGSALGACPVYGITSPDGKRLFVLNRASDTITVINSQNNTLDQCAPFQNQAGQPVTCHPVLPLSTTAVTAINTAYTAAGSPANLRSGTPPNGTTGMPTVAGPVYAEYNAATSQLVVADYDGGTISIIDVSLDIYGNDSATFGTTYTVKVGNSATSNPASVTVLNDGSRAYTANQNDDATGNGTGNGTVSVVDLVSHTLVKTLAVTGHPRTVLSTQNSLYGKVYVVAPDSPYLSIIRTDQDIIDTTVLVEGNIVDARVTTQDASRGNVNNVSRKPGFGQPCNLSQQQLNAANMATPTYQQCGLQTAP